MYNNFYILIMYKILITNIYGGILVLNKKIIFFAIFFVSLLAFSTVSAADNLTDDMVNSEQSIDDELGINENSDVVSVDSDDNELSLTQDDTLSASKGSFKELSNLIKKTGEKKVLKLKKDYKYDSSYSDTGIVIDNPITIDGNGHTIDGDNQARAFYVTGNDVTIKNVIFKNCYLAGSSSALGGSIRWFGSNGHLTNCVFSNSKTVVSGNNANSNGGAVYWSGSDGRLTNCAFNDCYSSYNKNNYNYNYNSGGAVFWAGNSGVISNSRFTNCIVDAYSNSYGGAVYCSGYNCDIINSRFTSCRASARSYAYGGAVYWDNSYGILRNCQFSGCFATGNSGSYGAAVYWEQSHGLIDCCSFIGNSENENGVVYIYGDYMDVESSTFMDNAVNNLYWTGSNGEVHNSILYSKTTYYPIYSANSNVNANYNWWGNTILDYKVKKYSLSRITNNNWLYLTVTTDKNSLSVGESANININLNNLYGNGGTSQYSNSKLGAITFTITDESFTNYFTVKNGFGTYRYVAKSVPMDPVVVQFDTHVTILKYNVKKVSTKIIAPQVKTVYNSGQFLKITLKDKYNNLVSGTIVGVKLNGKTLLLTTDYLGQININLNGFKPKKYSVKIQFVGDKNYLSSFASTKIIIKKATPKFKITKTFKKKSKKKIVKITLRDGIGPIKKIKVSLKLKGKTYKAKTNSKGVVKFNVAKKLKKAGKYNAVLKVSKTKVYNPIKKKIKIKVKKS